MLRGGELCVCQLNAVIALAPSTISAHLAELKDAGLVAERKTGRWVHYRLAAEGAGRGRARRALARARRRPAGRARTRRLLDALTSAAGGGELCRPGFDLAALRASCCPPPTAKEGDCA